MKKNLILAATALLALACNKNEITKVFEVTPEEREIQLTYDGASKVIGITSNVEWGAEANEEWIILDRTSGNDSRPIYVSATVNPSTEVRVGYVNITAEKETVTIAIIQDGAPGKDPVDPVDPVDPPAATKTVDYSFYNAPFVAFGTAFAINSLNWTIVWDGDDVIAAGKVTDNATFQCKQFGTENFVIHKMTISTTGLKGKVTAVDVKVAKSGSTSSPLFDHVSVGGTNLTAPESVNLPSKTPASNVFTVASGSLTGELEIVIKESGSDPATCGIRLQCVSITMVDE